MVDTRVQKGYTTYMETLPDSLITRLVFAPDHERRDILYAYFDELGLDFYKDSLPDIVDLIVAAYHLGVDHAY